MLLRTTTAGVTFYRSTLLAHVPHAFSTRLGGVSVGPFTSLNLGNPNGCPVQDDLANIAENYRRLQAAIGCEGRSRAQVHQVHGCDVLPAPAGEAFDVHAKADGLTSDDPAKLLSVRTADCVPVLLASRDGRCVAAVHAGWRGVVAGIAPAAARLLTERYGVAPEGLIAAIGPSIGADAFEVGPEVVAAFDARYVRPLPAGKGLIDLRAVLADQLRAAGLGDDAVDTTDRCTVTHADEFFSHRRENGVTGRMASMIGAV
jgi:polyphenol oxidase